MKRAVIVSRPLRGLPSTDRLALGSHFTFAAGRCCFRRRKAGGYGVRVATGNRECFPAVGLPNEKAGAAVTRARRQTKVLQRLFHAVVSSVSGTMAMPYSTSTCSSAIFATSSVKMTHRASARGHRCGLVAQRLGFDSSPQKELHYLYFLFR